MLAMQQETEYLTPRQVAQELGVGESTVLQWLREKRLPGYRFGYRWKVKKAELENWKNQRRNYQGPVK